MRRLLLGAAAVAGLIATAMPAPPAAADYHPACVTGPAGDFMSMSVDGTTFNFTGVVDCGGAQSAAITSFTLTHTTQPGTVYSGNAASCTSPCSSTLVSTGSAPAALGLYDLRMTFTATDHHGTWNPTPRRIRYYYTGSGQPRVICSSYTAVKCGQL